MTRQVVLICGPPGAGKTTLAHTLGLTVYDLDDEQWHQDERRFRRALAELAHDPTAQAAVIRSGATRSARTKAAALTAATETRIILTPLEECIRRINHRHRLTQPISVQVQAAIAWWNRYQPDATDLRTSRDW